LWDTEHCQWSHLCSYCCLQVLFSALSGKEPASKHLVGQCAPCISHTKWSDEANAKLQDCFAITDWNMFRDSSDDIEEYTTSVTGFINKCIEDVFPTVTTYPNQKPWITGNIRTELKCRAAAFKVQDSNPEAYEKSCYALRRTIKQATCQYRAKIESYYTGSYARLMWQGLQTITDYKGKHSRKLPSDTSLPDKINYFYAHFEASISCSGQLCDHALRSRRE
jgi:hypothetical protein